jgi:hypothetical protein
MSGYCSICGEKAQHTETHHDDHTKDDHDPDNLRPVHRRCHMHHHENDRATDNQTTQQYGPPSPSVGQKR